MGLRHCAFTPDSAVQSLRALAIVVMHFDMMLSRVIGRYPFSLLSLSLFFSMLLWFFCSVGYISVGYSYFGLYSVYSFVDYYSYLLGFFGFVYWLFFLAYISAYTRRRGLQNNFDRVCRPWYGTLWPIP